MNTYIALLRGINVGGKKVKMADLKVLLQDMGLNDIATYIQSGNVVFRSSQTDSKKLQEVIEKELATTFNFEVPVLVLRPEELEKIRNENPFANRPGHDTKLLYTAFLFEKPQKDLVAKLAEFTNPDEPFHVTEAAIYLYPKNGYGEAKLNNNFFEKKLKVSATTRNWNTVNKLLTMAG